MSQFQSIRPRSSNPVDDDLARPAIHSSDSQVMVGKARKRKAPAQVSQNACTNCKKARAKCDGIDGQTCSRCNSRSLAGSCSYELHVKTAKEELVRKIKYFEDTVETLQAEVREKDEWIQTIKEVFNPTSHGSKILQQLQQDDKTYRDLIALLSSAPAASKHVYITSTRDVDTDDVSDTTEDEVAPSRWTNVTQEDSKIDHFMTLYFSWVHPAHMLFSEHSFMNNFKHNSRVYCSPALVNAICAMGCRYYTDNDGPNEVAVRRLGERFTQQARAELRAEKAMTPLSSVTYAIMFLVELSAGSARDAFSHLRLAIDSLQDVDRREWSDEAFQITLYGIHALNVNWAALTYQKPPDPTAPHHKNVFEKVNTQPRPDDVWRSYKITSDQGVVSPTYAMEVAKEFAKLSLIHLETIIAWCGSAGKIRTKDIFALYRKYLSWKHHLKRHLGAEKRDAKDKTILPFVLLLHINYAVGICQLFNPLLESRDMSPRAKAEISKVLVHSAREGLSVYEQFSYHFTNRYQTPLQAFCLVHLADVILRRDRQAADKVIHFTLQQLGEALPGFPVVGALQAMFCETVLACRLELPKDVDILMGGRSWKSYTREDKLGCSERLTYAQPVDRLAEAIDNSVPLTFEREWKAFLENQARPQLPSTEDRVSDESGSSSPGVRTSDQRFMDISSIINP